MWKCPICNNEEKTEYLCQKCGYDLRKDFLRNRTIQPVPVKDVQVYVNQISEYNPVQQTQETNKKQRKSDNKNEKIKVKPNIQPEKNVRSREKSSKWSKIAIVIIILNIIVRILSATVGSYEFYAAHFLSRNPQAAESDELDVWNQQELLDDYETSDSEEEQQQLKDKFKGIN